MASLGNTNWNDEDFYKIWTNSPVLRERVQEQYDSFILACGYGCGFGGEIELFEFWNTIFVNDITDFDTENTMVDEDLLTVSEIAGF